MASAAAAAPTCPVHHLPLSTELRGLTSPQPYLYCKMAPRLGWALGCGSARRRPPGTGPTIQGCVWVPLWVLCSCAVPQVCNTQTLVWSLVHQTPAVGAAGAQPQRPTNPGNAAKLSIASWWLQVALGSPQSLPHFTTSHLINGLCPPHPSPTGVMHTARLGRRRTAPACPQRPGMGSRHAPTCPSPSGAGRRLRHGQPCSQCSRSIFFCPRDHRGTFLLYLAVIRWIFFWPAAATLTVCTSNGRSHPS